MQQSKFGGVPVKESKFGGILAVDEEERKRLEAIKNAPPAPIQGPFQPNIKPSGGMSPFGGPLGMPPREMPDEIQSRKRAFQGVGEEGVSAGVLAGADLTNEENSDYRRLIAQKRNIPIESVQVWDNPQVGEKVYRVKEGENWGRPNTIFGKDGIAEDLLANPSAIAGTILETSLGYQGAKLGPGAAVVAAAAGSGLSREARLLLGKFLGKNDYSSTEIHLEALKDAALTLVAGGLGEGVVGAYKFMKEPAIDAMIKNMSRTQFDEVILALESMTADELKKEFGVDFSLSQILKQARRDTVTGRQAEPLASQSTVEGFAALEQQLKNSSPELRVTFDKQADLKALQRQGLTDDNARLLNEPNFKQGQVQDEIQGQIQPVIQAEKDVLQSKSDAITKKYEDALDNMFKGDTVAKTAEDLSSVLTPIRQGIKDEAGAPYQAFWGRVLKDDAGNPKTVSISTDKINDFASKYAKDLEKDPFKSLHAEDKAIVMDALEFGKITVKTPASPAGKIIDRITGKPFIKDQGATTRVEAQSVDMETISKAVSVLKKEKNRIKNSLDKTVNARFLNDMIDVFERTRNSVLEGLEQGSSKALKEIDSAYGNTLRSIDTANINRILKSSTGGRPDMTPVQQIEALAADNGRAAMHFMNMVEEGSDAALLAFPQIKKSMKALYKNKVLGLSGESRQTAHDQFLREYGDALETLLPRQSRLFRGGPEKTLKMIADTEKNLTRELDVINRAFKTEFANTSGDLVEFVTAKTGREAARNTNTLMKYMTPESLDGYKALRHKKILNDISVKDSSNIKIFDPDKIDGLIASNREELTELYGSQYVRDLEKFARFGDITKVPAGKMTQEIKELTTIGVLKGAGQTVARAFFAPPLSRKGLVATAIFKVSKEKTRAAIGEILASPASLRKAMKLYESKANFNQWRKAFQTPALNAYFDEILDPFQGN